MIEILGGWRSLLLFVAINIIIKLINNKNTKFPKMFLQCRSKRSEMYIREEINLLVNIEIAEKGGVLPSTPIHRKKKL